MRGDEGRVRYELEGGGRVRDQMGCSVPSTVTDTRITSASTSKLFTSKVGTPQGNNNITHVLKKFRPALPRPTTPFTAEIPNEEAFADDADFFGQNYADNIIIKSQEFILRKILSYSQHGQDGVHINITKQKSVERSKDSRNTCR